MLSEVARAVGTGDVDAERFVREEEAGATMAREVTPCKVCRRPTLATRLEVRLRDLCGVPLAPVCGFCAHLARQRSTQEAEAGFADALADIAEELPA